MPTITKKELVERVADGTEASRADVKKVVQRFLDEMVKSLCSGHRLEFRDFGVFETRLRAARTAQNPKTLKPVHVPERRTVKFKPGREFRAKLDAASDAAARIEVKTKRSAAAVR